MDLDSVWAKRSADGVSSHPLLCHMIDVAEVAKAMLDQVESPATLAWLEEGTRLNESALKSWFIWLAGMHDVGKANRAFQEQIGRQSRDLPHGTVTSGILRSVLPKPPFELDKGLANRIATIVGGHHGIIPKDVEISAVFEQARSSEWKGVWPQLVERFTHLYPTPNETPHEVDNARAIWLAGFVSVVDWIGSNAEYFPFAGRAGVTELKIDLDAYRETSRESADRALRELGWLAKPSTTAPMTFQQLFPFIPEPNDLQQTVMKIADKLDRPGLVIIEAPMGEGKTEAALYLADQANVRWGMRGAYVALPTMATSNQMFGRVRDFLEHRYYEFVQIQLQHGQANLSDEVEALEMNFEAYLTFAEEIDLVNDEVGSADSRQHSAVAASWFSGRKQAMLAPFGVGTIDQLLLSVLPIKHYFVRLFGASNKTIILDEVHAYDSYMTTLIERMLGWLATMNCHVILLSATLPAEKRAKLLRAYQRVAGSNEPATETDDGAYPRISWVSGSQSGNRDVTASERGKKQLGVRWLSLNADDPNQDLAEHLHNALERGGCAAVICNTVRRAQDVYKALQTSEFFDKEELGLFHAQFVVGDRREIEKMCLDEFGKDSTCRPPRKVLVATQVIEQSLDLDFDLMVSEIAPIDLLFQRSGRLHRHKRDSRPSGLESPEFWIIAPGIQDGKPEFDSGSQYVYFTRILAGTWQALNERSEIGIPADVAGLIASVYDGIAPPLKDDPELGALLASTYETMSEQILADARQAELMQIAPPRTTGKLGTIARIHYDDEDADVNPNVRTATRLGDPSVAVVFFHGSLERARFAANGPVYDLTRPNRDLARLCLLNSASISRWEVVNDLLKESPPAAWRSNSYLRTLRAVSLDDDQGNGGGGRRNWRIEIDENLGIQISKAEGA